MLLDDRVKRKPVRRASACRDAVTSGDKRTSLSPEDSVPSDGAPSPRPSASMSELSTSRLSVDCWAAGHIAGLCRLGLCRILRSMTNGSEPSGPATYDAKSLCLAQVLLAQPDDIIAVGRLGGKGTGLVSDDWRAPSFDRPSLLPQKSRNRS